MKKTQQTKYDSYYQLGNLRNKVQYKSFFEQKIVTKPFWNVGSLELKSQQQKFEDRNVEGPLFKQSLKTGMLKEKKICILEDKLVQLDDKGKILKYMDLDNVTLDRSKTGKQDEQIKFGFKLIKNQQQVEFFAESEQICEIWVQQLRKFCIQRFFQNTYYVTKIIGRGSSAKVYLANNKLTGRQCAVKAFDKNTLLNQDKPALIKEIQIMRKLTHRGLLKLQEVYENEQIIFLVCDYLEGGEIFKELVKNQVADENTFKQIIQEILFAVEYMHENGIMHRDIKPQNICLRNRGDFKDVCLADFGLADYYNQQGKYLYKRCGTPGYVAPEILQDKNYDFKVDLFSIGVIMFIMFSGVSPFQASSNQEIILRNQECTIDFTTNNLQSKISTEGLSLLVSLLQQDPSKRPSCSEALQHKWFFELQNQEQEYIYPYIPPKFCQDIFSKTPLMNQNQGMSRSFTPLDKSRNSFSGVISPQPEISSTLSNSKSQPYNSGEDNATQTETKYDQTNMEIELQKQQIDQND